MRGYYTCFVLRDLCLDSPLTQWYVAPYPLLRENFPSSSEIFSEGRGSLKGTDWKYTIDWALGIGSQGEYTALGRPLYDAKGFMFKI